MVKKIESIQVIDAEKRRIPSKHYVYVIIVTWSDGSRVTVYRRYSRFFDLQTRLLDHFPIEAGTIDPEKRLIPFLPGKIFFGRSQIKDVAMKRLKEIDEYCKNLIKLPAHIAECDDVLEFFEVEPEDLEPPTDSHDKNKAKSSQEIKAEKISRPKRFECYVAVAMYSSQAAGELSLKPGLKVEVLEKSDSGWWFVNSQDEQGWVPSTYLEREGGSDPLEKQGQIADPGQEENYICIEKFDAASTDEVSLEKGSVVQVLQKNLDGWWLIRYKGKEAYAPGTYLKKANNMHFVSVVEKSRLSGVQVISSLHDVSNLLNQESKTSKEPVRPAVQPQNKDTQRVSSNIKHTGPSAIIKQRSLERGGSLNPPPRQNSVMKMDIPPSVNVATVYITADDFTDTVGDGLSFKKGEKVVVSEKTSSGWWFVKIGNNEGWVPATYLEQCSESKVDDSIDYEDDDDWYVEPEDVEDIADVHIASVNPAKRPLPAEPPDEKLLTESAARPTLSSHADKLPVVTPKIATSSYKLDAVTKSPEANNQSSSEPSVNEATARGPKHTGSQDLASMLKARFEARGKTSGSSSDEDSPADSRSNTSGLQKIPNTKNTPTIPSKPFDLRASQDLKSQKSSNSGDTKSVSKPPPPAKSKPLKPGAPAKPSVIPSGMQASKPAKLPLPSKPESKPISGNEDKSPEKMHLKSPAGGMGRPDNIKLELQKPKITSKPQISSKPKTTVSSNVIATGKSADQSVNNIAKSLSGKLSFGQPSNILKSPSEGMKSHSGVTVGVPKPSAALTPSKSKSHIAVFTFVAENDGELGFSEGDELEVLEQQGDWSLVRILGKEGWAPSGYFQKL